MSQDHENNADISKADPEIFALCQEEEARQIQGLELVASENFTSRAVRQALSSSFTNKYSEGYPGARYYGGNEVVDKVESLCQNRALAAFGLREEEWGVNVQPYSGTPANFAVYTGLLKPHDRIMGLDLPHGGHLSHGYQTDKKRISATSIYFESMPYRLGEDGYVDYDGLDASASLFRPKMIICGGSAYPRDWDYKRVREICDKVGAYMHVDMAHYAGLVAAKELRSPFEYADTVMTTTHKSLRGPRGAMVFYRVGDKYEYKTAIDFAVFPGLQGGPHENTIAAIAVALHETQGEHFVGYQQQVKANIKALADGLVEKGYNLVSGGTETHLILWDLRPQGVSGSKVEKVCDQVNITVNKNSVPGDRSAVVPGGLRVGAPALTSRGLKEEDFKKIAEFLHKTVEIAQEVQKETGPKLVDFMKVLVEHKDLPDLRQQVSSLASHFPMPGAGLATGELIS